ncbi:MAG: hypothetical protein CL723_03225 [Chloroflexi bacterium]|jgi:crotonobetaine/carnitine-CoA ligase|nr:hypothetical protein [Chloroflexota bacterium]|tara:strand:+ start:7295 stop:8806 length:1512 start_codon:yes stop_codon:yes gene_type:complete
MNSSEIINLDSIIKLHAKENPSKTALIFVDIDKNIEETVTYSQLDILISKTCNYLNHNNYKKNDKLLINIPNSFPFVILLLACFRMGIVAVTTNPNLTTRELKYQFKQSGSKNIISIKSDQSKNSLSSFATLDNNTLMDFTNLINKFNSQFTSDNVDLTDEATILFTSGTTNFPKGVISTHSNYINKIKSVSNVLRLNSNDRHYLTLPLFHTNGQYSLLAILFKGGSAVICSRFSASNYFKIAAKYKVTLSTLFASTIRMLLLSGINKYEENNNIRLIMFAQSVSEEELKQWQKRFKINLIQIYGMSETTGMISANPLINPRNMSMGKILDIYKYRISNEYGKNLNSFEAGELVLRGIQNETLMKGYINEHEATLKTIVNNELYTGDIVYKDNEEFIYFVDRKNDVIKRSGENISTIEIEHVILNHPKVKEVSVVGYPDKIMDYKIFAFIIPKNKEISTKEIKEFCKINLISYKVPEKIIFVDKFPLTAVGKIQKYKLKEKYK